MAERDFEEPQCNLAGAAGGHKCMHCICNVSTCRAPGLQGVTDVFTEALDSKRAPGLHTPGSAARVLRRRGQC